MIEHMNAAQEEDIEKLMVRLGVQRYAGVVDKAKAEGHLSSAPHLQPLLSHSIQKMEKSLTEWLAVASTRPGKHHHAVKFLQQVPIDVASLITCKLVVDSMIKGPVNETKMSRAVGRAVEEEARLSVFRKESYLLWKDLERTQKRATVAHKKRVFLAAARRATTSFKEWGQKDRLIVGLVLLDHLTQHTGIVDRMNVKRKKRNRYITDIVLTPTQEAVEWMEKAEEEHALNTPVYLPTLDPPADWKTNWDGGYHGFTLTRTGLMRTRKGTRHLLDGFNAARVPVVFEALNAMQRVPWRLNLSVYSAAEHFWKAGAQVAGFPLRDNEPLPSKPVGMANDPELLKVWKREAHGVHSRNAERIGHRLLVSKILSTAGVFHKLGRAFYFPMKLCFRGRSYFVPSFLEPQGSDLSKGLLQFDEAKTVTVGSKGEEWLAIHGANCWGEDKLPWAERVAWSHQHSEEIQRCASDPLDNRWWAEADKPWQFLAFCFEWAELRDSGKVESRIPVAMDGSNNGLQIFSLMLRDTVGGAATNCVPGDAPRDIYQDVADLVTQRLRDSDEDWAREWLGFLEPWGGLPRKAVKRPVMTLPYGVKRTTARDYFRDWYREVRRRSDVEDPLLKKIFDLSDMVWSSIENTVPRAVEAMSWLREVAGVAADKNQPLIWTTPIGLRVGQSYPMHITERVTTTLGSGVRRNAYYPTDGDKQHKGKMKDAVSPNVVHSLDASAMYLTVNKCLEKGLTTFSMVHDSFATHAANAEVMAESLREAYHEVFSGNFLLDFKQQVERQLNVELPDPPEQGSLDPEAVKHSTYFFL